MPHIRTSRLLAPAFAMGLVITSSAAAQVQQARSVFSAQHPGPWNGSDPIVASAHIVTALQTIVSRDMALTDNPAVVTIGKITGGVRNNIVPEQVEMLGTIRSLNPADRQKLHARVREIVSRVATSLGATATVGLSGDREQRLAAGAVGRLHGHSPTMAL